MAELAVFSVLLIVFIALVSQLFGLSAIIVVAMASLVWPFVWMLVIRRFSLYRKELKNAYFEKKLPGAKNQIVLFAGAGMLAQSIGSSAVVGGAIDPALCGISAAYLALVLSMSWALGNTICPASANVIAVADMVQASPMEASLKWNGLYAVITAALLIASVMLMRGLGFL